VCVWVGRRRKKRIFEGFGSRLASAEREERFEEFEEQFCDRIVCCVVLWEVSLLFLEEIVKTGSFWKLVAFFVWVVLCFFLASEGWVEGRKDSGE
jgi:hypothetical protein